MLIERHGVTFLCFLLASASTSTINLDNTHPKIFEGWGWKKLLVFIYLFYFPQWFSAG
jgi:hypothetical protein